MASILQCMESGKSYSIDSVIYTSPETGGLLDVWHDLDQLKNRVSRGLFDERMGKTEKPYNSGVWRFKELVYPDLDDKFIISKPEGNTNLYHVPGLAEWANVTSLYLKHEGENPTGSFKDRGMTTGVTQAIALGMTRVACASTGNTSASLASYAAAGGLDSVVFFENKNVALGKLSQAIAYGAKCIQISADFDRNMELVREVSGKLGIYVLNSVNPFRLEGQKSIIFEMIQQLNWQTPDWIVVPGGNLGNSSAFGKALYELQYLGLIEKTPRIAIIQADGASPLYDSYDPAILADGYRRGQDELIPTKADTIATAIKIGNPVNFAKAVRTLRWTNGIVEKVSDQEIMDAKALIDRQGIGCEPASACSLAGTRKLAEKGVIRSGEFVVGILTGHLLKDPDATIGYHQDTLKKINARYSNALYEASDNPEDIIKILTQ